MISKYNILNGTRIVDIDKECDDEILEDIKIWDSVKISMSFDTYKHKNHILRRIGSEYEKNITVIPNDDNNFGKVFFVFSNKFFMKKQREYTIQMIKEEPIIDTTDLDKAVTIYSPQWLIMSRNTMVLLYDRKCCDTNHSHPFYHDYKNIPVAVNEFIPAGEVVFITE
ncbi:MAG: hypothetical protein NC548_15895 [Lachnospiraceae bacterium]|nr:hypothetical protein [Lachnospiraceae bacterium]